MLTSEAVKRGLHFDTMTSVDSESRNFLVSGQVDSMAVDSLAVKQQVDMDFTSAEVVLTFTCSHILVCCCF